MRSVNHRDIAAMYFYFGIWRAAVGTGLRIVVRLELRSPGSFLGNDQLYNSVVTAHALVIIFFFYAYYSWWVWELVGSHYDQK